MPEITNNSKINTETTLADDASYKTMISVKNVGMKFNMASEQLNNLKEYFLAIVKRNLFYKELKALEDISFEVKQGDVFGIVGTNGSGKSTLLKIVAGVLEPSAGTVEINGEIAPLIELGAGFDMELSARENIYLNGALLGHPKAFIDKHFNDIVEFAEIEKFLDMPMKNYSSGMIARIAFAIATVIIPEILIVDEVLSVGDFMFQKKCEDKILELIKNHNTTVLIVSHSNDQIKRLCNKAIWIEKGKTRIIGSADEVCAIYGLIGGREGTLEAENTILQANETHKCENPETAHQIAHGNTYNEVCLSLARCAKQTSYDTICLVSQDTHLNVACANSFAGQYDSPVISFSNERINYHIIDWIENKKPKNIFIFDFLDANISQEYEKHNYTFDTNVRRFVHKHEDPFVICTNIFNSTKEIINYSKRAIITSYESHQESAILLSKLTYSCNIPYFCIDIHNKNSTQMQQEEHNNKIKRQMKELKNLCFDDVIIAGQDVNKFALEEARHNFSKVCDLTAGDFFKSQENILKFIKEEAKEQPIEEAIILPNLNVMPSTGAASGYYCTQNNGCAIVVDDTNLDSIAFACKKIEEFSISNLVFLGGPGALSEPVVNLLSKIASSNSKHEI